MCARHLSLSLTPPGTASLGVPQKLAVPGGVRDNRQHNRGNLGTKRVPGTL